MTPTIKRVYAFGIVPRKGTDVASGWEPAGGVVKVSQPLEQIIRMAFSRVAPRALTAVDFELDANRQNIVREALMAVAFGSTKTPKAAAVKLARRLCEVMDNRSHPALLLVVVEEGASGSVVSLLLLPREDVVQLQQASQDEDLMLDLVRDAFSMGSGLRKMARVSGHDARTQFLSAEILDLQLTASDRSVADFWVRDFLNARYQMNAEAGSRLLSQALKRCFSEAADDDKDAVFAAMCKLSGGVIRRTSLRKFADDELPESAQELLLRGTEEAAARATFEVSRDVVREQIGRRIFETTDGVVLSAPAEVVGGKVEVSGHDSRRIVSYSGVVEKERVSSRGRSKEAPAIDGRTAHGRGRR